MQWQDTDALNYPDEYPDDIRSVDVTDKQWEESFKYNSVVDYKLSTLPPIVPPCPPPSEAQ